MPNATLLYAVLAQLVDDVLSEHPDLPQPSAMAASDLVVVVQGYSISIGFGPEGNVRPLWQARWDPDTMKTIDSAFARLAPRGGVN